MELRFYPSIQSSFTPMSDTPVRDLFLLSLSYSTPSFLLHVFFHNGLYLPMTPPIAALVAPPPECDNTQDLPGCSCCSPRPNATRRSPTRSGRRRTPPCATDSHSMLVPRSATPRRGSLRGSRQSPSSRSAASGLRDGQPLRRRGMPSGHRVAVRAARQAQAPWPPAPLGRQVRVARWGHTGDPQVVHRVQQFWALGLRGDPPVVRVLSVKRSRHPAGSKS